MPARSTAGACLVGARRVSRRARVPAGTRSRAVRLRLAYRQPSPVSVLFAFLADRAVPGVEEGDRGYYRRALSLPHGAGVASVRDGGDGSLHCSLRLDDMSDLAFAAQQLRQLFDLDADPVAVAEVLGRDRVLGPAVAALPGLRVPGHVDGNELAFRAVIGQQVSVAGARRLAGRLANAYGRPLAAPVGAVEREFPSAEVLASLRAEELPMPRARGAALISLAGAIVSGRIVLDRTADRDSVCADLLSIRGIGPWTVAYVHMRALGDSDSFMAGDLGVRRALERLGLPGGERQAIALAANWRPYRAYALQYLWTGLGEGTPSDALRSERANTLDETGRL